ncbi:MAG TPA: heparinase II/III family protein, partial [Armatimonadota bacterium]|nr:heparinase II/III family protein [Armatimonadota bacterium]
MPSTRECHYEIIARELCAAVDWSRPELAALRTDDPSATALALVRHLRARRTPRMGYSAAYVARLRAHAAADFRTSAEAEIHRLLRVPFMGGDWPDGRGTLLHCRPEVLHVAAAREDYDRYADCVAASRDTWARAAHHTIMYLTRYLQIVWEAAECADAAVLPILGFLVYRMHHEWDGAKRWDEVMLGTQGHNWYVAQYGATWKAAFLFPEFTGFTRWHALFPHYFEREMRLLLFPDGFTHEVSVNYHSGTMDLFLDCARIAELNGLRLSDAFMDKLYKGYEVEWKLMCPDGGMPPFGDCWSRGPYFLDRARSVAALLGIPEAKWLAETFAPADRSPFGPMLIETLHYPSVGEDLAPSYQAVAARPPATADTTLPDSGYYVMRENWTRESDYAAIEAAAKGNLITSHGHGAIFDLLLYAKGRQITAGNGKGPDGVDDPERSWRHQTLSHTVAVVDAAHHLPLRSVYRFAGVVLPTVDEWISADEYAYFSGVHE